MRMNGLLAGLTALTLAGFSAAGAQGRAHENHLPPGQMPPAGLCRVWIDGVPPGRQPGATDCATAQSQVPYNGRVIYGPQAATSIRRRYYTTAPGEVMASPAVQRCVQRVDAYGVVRTVSRDDRAAAAAAYRARMRHARKHDDDRDRGQNRDQNRDRK